MDDRRQLEKDLRTLVESGLVVALYQDGRLGYVVASMATEEQLRRALPIDALEQAWEHERRIEAAGLN